MKSEIELLIKQKEEDHKEITESFQLHTIIFNEKIKELQNKIQYKKNKMCQDVSEIFQKYQLASNELNQISENHARNIQRN
ncbi:hypothetical protein DICPUDRAFT_159776 [Dictyostelium purpureum]|uniref:Uncharacterized protein n=1 Tax=Dictyostelium purpureum TaxID=5786 RepID=F1A4Y9_DICPU|nr:uncharacterized protein DICPUDRAFT_159776 [Dictyostelium purpureum]EGC28742.1 hypothetical protein DICPUDRAFT_159776 [Dictyostelium purpureum]|eukprot:XP_003294732.1 hypothetical protein DICPUDRAFT_159776 [Dictyostelium purpureum]